MNFEPIELIFIFSFGVLCGMYVMYIVARNIIIPWTLNKAKESLKVVEDEASLNALGMVLKGLHLGAIESLADYTDHKCVDAISSVCCRSAKHIEYIHKQLELPESTSYLNNITSLKQIGTLKEAHR